MRCERQAYKLLADWPQKRPSELGSARA